MKKLITLSLLLLCSYCIKAQSVIYSQNFESTYTDWSLSTTDLGGTPASAGSNVWIINNIYAAGTLGTPTPTEPAGITGAPSSTYMHINCGTLYLPLYGSNDNFNATGSGESYFAALNTPINTSSYTNVYFSFWWICAGDAASAGKVYYRTSAGGAWTQITTPVATFYSSTTWTKDSVHIPAFDGQAFLEFGFQFTDGDGLGLDPAFGIDQIMVTGTGSTTGTSPVASFTSPTSSTCADSCVTYTSTSTGTVDSMRWRTSPAGPTVSVPTGSVTGICFPTAGTYSVMLTAYGSGSMSASSAVITISPAPHPTITKVGHLLSVPAVYTSYQWDSNTVAITGATSNSYTYSVEGPVYSVVVDSAGCRGTSTSVSTVGILPVSPTDQFFYVSQQSGNAMLWSSEITDNNLQVTVFDIAGRQVANETMQQGSNHLVLNTANLTTGLYIIKIYGKNTVEILKWMKQ